MPLCQIDLMNSPLLMSQLVSIMGPNNSSPLEGCAHLQQYWQPQQQDDSVFVHHITHQQIQRHFIRVPAREISREYTLFTSRINNPQSGVCRLFCYHPAEHEQISPGKELREICGYTDRLLLVREWSRERVLQVVEGLKKLIPLYGCFRVNEHNIRQDCRGETRVWISENPVSNYPDFRYAGEEQVVGDLAALLIRKRSGIADLFLGCRSLKEVGVKLMRGKEGETDYSYRSEQVQRVEGKPVGGKGNQGGKVYREMELAPVIKTEGVVVENKPQYGTYQPQKKHSSNSDNFGSYASVYYAKKTPAFGVPSEKVEKAVNWSKPQNEPSPLFVEEQTEYSSIKNTMKSAYNLPDSPAKKSEPKIMSSNFMQYKQSVSPIVFGGRFSTVTTPTAATHGTSNPKRIPSPHSGSGSKFPPFLPAKDPSVHPQSGCEGRAGGCEITIINNNVNNFISNFTHQHIVGQGKKQQGSFQFRRKNDEKPNSGRPPFQKGEVRQGGSIPLFIKEKRRGNEMPVEKQTTVGEVSSREQTMRTMKERRNQFQLFFNDTPSEYGLELNKSEKALGVMRKEMPEGLDRFGVGREETVGPLPFSGKTLVSEPMEKESNSNTSFESRLPLRTKTTEFYSKGRESGTEELGQTKKSVVLTGKKRKEFQAQKQSPYASREAQQFGRTPSRNKKHYPPPSPIKSSSPNFKQLLKQQLSSVMGEQLLVSPRKQSGNLGKEEELRAEEMVKEKIEMKKIAFAELRKEALKVLTDG